jgi:filamentous hemagglutinin family protein
MLGGRVDLHERFRRYLYTAMVPGASLVCAAGLAVSLAYAQVPVTTQITGHGQLGTTVTPVANGVEITGGTRPGPGGPNLFHSFGLFNVGTGDTANFVNNSALPTTNIIGRVTDARSDIFGTVKTTGFGAASLWLINPKGFVFGPGATLDVGGSFHASTADYVKFSDGKVFYADPAQTSALSVMPPSAFGFLSAPTGRIDVLAGTADQTTNPVTINSLLKVPEGKTVSLVGGTVNVGGQVDLNNDGTPDVSGGSYILAPGGHVNLVSVVSSGEATFDPTNINGSTGGPVTGVPSTRDINVAGFGQLGNINITRGSIVDGKEVSISGGQLVIDTAAVYPGSFWLYRNLGVLTVSGISTLRAPNGGLVNVNIAGDVSIRGDTVVPVINDLSGILTVAGFPFAQVQGDVPNIRLNAHSLTLSGEKASIQAVRFGPDKAADVSITAADSVRIEKGATIEAVNFFQGPGGSLSVNTGDLVIDGGGSSDFTGIRAQGRFHPGYRRFSVDPIVYSAESGTITVNASNNVTLRNSGFISANSFTFGNGGGVTVNTKNLSLDNRSLIIAESTLGGSAGNVEINASGQVNLTNTSQISSTTTGSGTGGNVVVTAGQPTTVSSSSGIFASTVPPNQGLLDFFASNFGLPNYAALQSIVSRASGIPNPSIFDVLRVLRDNFRLLQFPDSVLIPGNGGAISITTPLLTVNSGAAVSSSTSWDGNAGQVLANVGSLIVASGGEIRSRTGLVDATGTSLVGRGNAGELRIDATDTITVTGGSISTTTIGNGTAGNISLSANEVNVRNGGSVTSASGQTVNGKLIVGTGNGGTVNMTGTDISVSGTGSTISTNTLGNGNGGGVSLTAGRSVNIVNGGLVSADSLGGTGLAGNIEITAGDQIAMTDGSVSTRAVTSDGGNITLNAPRMIQLTDSQVTTSVESGAGGGGNINIDPQALILNNSQILANAFGGPGGNINIIADVFLVNNNGVFPTSLTGIVDASSALSTPGTVNIEATFTNVVGTFAQLPSTPLQASELLRASCAARFAGGKASSLVLAGRDGLPLQPGDLLPSPLYVVSDADAPSTGDNRLTGQELPTRFSLLGSKDRLLSQYSLLPNAKCSL